MVSTIKHQPKHPLKSSPLAIAGSSKNITVVDPCSPRGYSRNEEVMVRTSGASRSTMENQYIDSGNGNFTECRSSSLLLLQKGKGKKYIRNLNCSHRLT